MNHVEQRLRDRFNITGVSRLKLRALSKHFGDLVVEDTNKDGEQLEIYRLDLEGKTVYPLLVNGHVKTVYWSSYVECYVRRAFKYNKKKMVKLLKKMR